MDVLNEDLKGQMAWQKERREEPLIGGSKAPPPELQTIEDDLLNDENDADSVRSKTSLRMHYEAQVTVLRRQLGDLESIRLGLGLSQRKMAQLLMVDPSSWTRWTRQGDEAPPHIWRALQWFSALNEKIPGLTPHYFINQSPQVLHQKALQELGVERSERQAELLALQEKIAGFSSERDELQVELSRLKKDLNFHKKITIVVLLLGLALVIITAFALPLGWKLFGK